MNVLNFNPKIYHCIERKIITSEEEGKLIILAER